MDLHHGSIKMIGRGVDASLTVAVMRMRARRRLRCECGRLRRLVAEVVDVKARRQSTEPWGRTPRFYRGDGCEKSNRPPRSPSLPRYTTTSRRGICARDPYPFPPKLRQTFRLPEQTRTLFPRRGYGSKSFFSGPHEPRGPRAGPTISTAVPTRDGPTSDQDSGTKASREPQCAIKSQLG